MQYFLNYFTHRSKSCNTGDSHNRSNMYQIKQKWRVKMTLLVNVVWDPSYYIKHVGNSLKTTTFFHFNNWTYTKHSHLNHLKLQNLCWNTETETTKSSKSPKTKYMIYENLTLKKNWFRIQNQDEPGIDPDTYFWTNPIFGELKLAHEDLEPGDERTEHEWVSHSRVFVGKHLVEVAQECKGGDRVELPMQLVEDQTLHAAQVVRSPPALTQLDQVSRAWNDSILLLNLRCDVEAARSNAGQVARVGLWTQTHHEWS